MGPLNRYLIAAVAIVACATVFLRPSGLVLAGLVLIAVATHLVVWNPERKEVFRDDWAEIAHDAAALVCGFVGVSLLVVAGVTAAVA